MTVGRSRRSGSLKPCFEAVDYFGAASYETQKSGHFETSVETQRSDWIDLQRAARGNKARDESNGGERRAGEDESHRVGGRNPP